MLAACGVMTVVCLSGHSQVGFTASALLLIIFAVAMFDNIRDAVKNVKNTPEERLQINGKKEIVQNVLKFLAGAAGIAVGADLLVDNGSALAAAIGIDDRIIAVTFVAIGTSLPELVTTITSIVKKQASLSAGNIIGANIIDMTLILPLCSLVSGKPLPITGTAGFLDIPASLVVGSVALIPALITKRFAKWQGILLLCVYLLYMFLTVFVFA